MLIEKDNKFIAMFFQHLRNERGLSENTIATYTNAFKRLALCLKCADIHNVTALQLQDFVIEICRNHERRSAHNYVSAIRTFFKFLRENKLVTVDPTESIVLPKLERVLPKIMNRQQIEQLLRAPREMLSQNLISQKIAARDEMILELFYGSGMRISELRNIKIYDIDCDSRVIKVVGKGNKERLCPFSLAAYRAIQQFWSICGKGDYLVCVDNKPPLSARQIENRMKVYLKFSGLPADLSPHTIRHAYATHLLNAGADIRLIQELLGHANLSTTQIYTHMDSRVLKDVHRRCHPHG